VRAFLQTQKEAIGCTHQTGYRGRIIPARRSIYPLISASATAKITASSAGGTATPSASGLGAGLIHVQRSSFKFLAIQAVYGGLRLSLGGHFRESKTFGSAAELVIDNGNGFNLPELAQFRP
jgi:hypothetical protein